MGVLWTRWTRGETDRKENNYSMSTAVNSRMGAQSLVQSTVFKNVTVPVTSRDSKQVG